jgi:class 3 adenylate cyclase
MPREKKTIMVLFMDVKGYSRIGDDQQYGVFFDRVLPEIATTLLQYKPLLVNSWGDAIVATFATAADAARAGLDLRDLFRNTNWKAKGLHTDLAARLGLHAGSVFVGHDPLQDRTGIAGHNVNLAARIEPVAQPNEVWMSESAAALLAEEKDDKLAWDDLGDRPLAKQWGSRRLFRLRRHHEPQDLQIDDLEKVASENPTDKKYEAANRLLKFGKGNDRIMALKMLAHLPGDEQVREFVSIAKSKDESQQIRNVAVMGLAEKRSAAAGSILMGIIKDDTDDLDVRDTAVVALGRVGGQGARDALLGVVDDDRLPGITRARAMRSLGQLSEWSVYSDLEAKVLEYQASGAIETEFALGFVNFCRLNDSSKGLSTLVSLATDQRSTEPLRAESLNAILFIRPELMSKDFIDDSRSSLLMGNTLRP